jgi:hypothetical protein
MGDLLLKLNLEATTIWDGNGGDYEVLYRASQPVVLPEIGEKAALISYGPVDQGNLSATMIGGRKDDKELLDGLLVDLHTILGVGYSYDESNRIVLVRRASIFGGVGRTPKSYDLNIQVNGEPTRVVTAYRRFNTSSMGHNIITHGMNFS